VTEFEQEHQGEACLSVIMLAFPSEWAFGTSSKSLVFS
jgi:hypothetical protein